MISCKETTTEYMKYYPIKSDKLGCNVNCFLTVKECDDEVTMIVTHIAVGIDDRRSQVFEPETIDRSIYEQYKSEILKDMVEI